MNYNKLTIYTAFLVLVLSGCASHLRSVEVLYTGNQGRLFFISPFSMESDNDADMKMDITFRHYANKDSAVKVSYKFSVFSKAKGIEKVSKAAFIFDKDTIVLNNPELYYIERDNNAARYECFSDYQAFKTIFSAPADNIKFMVSIPSGNIIFHSGSAFHKTYQAIHNEIFDTL